MFLAGRNVRVISERWGEAAGREFLHHLEEDYRKFPLILLWKVMERKVLREIR